MNSKEFQTKSELTGSTKVVKNSVRFKNAFVLCQKSQQNASDEGKNCVAYPFFGNLSLKKMQKKYFHFYQCFHQNKLTACMQETFIQYLDCSFDNGNIANVDFNKRLKLSAKVNIVHTIDLWLSPFPDILKSLHCKQIDKKSQ